MFQKKKMPLSETKQLTNLKKGKKKKKRPNNCNTTKMMMTTMTNEVIYKGIT